MKTIRLFFFLSILSFTATPVHAQFWKKLQDRVEKAAERTVLNKAERKTEQATDNTIEGALGGKKKGKKNRSVEEDTPPVKNQTTTPTPKAYTFNRVLEYEMKADRQNEPPLHITTQYYFNTSDPDILAIEMQMKDNKELENMSYVIDAEGASIILSEGGETHAVSIPKEYIKSIDFDKLIKGSNIKKTGKKKRILGYMCDEFTQIDEYSNCEMWVSRDSVIPTNLSNIFGTHQSEVFGNGMALQGKCIASDGTTWFNAKNISSVHKTITR